MKKIILPIILAVAIVAAILFLKPAVASTGAPLKNQEVVKNVFAIDNSFVNLYLFKSGEKYIAVDAGADAEATKTALADFGIDANDVVAVFMTHTDGDHVAGLDLFPSTNIYMSASNKIFLAEPAGSSRSKAFLEKNKTYKTLSDGETITVHGAQVKCIYAPGHTPGSVCYLVNGRYLFAGDNFNLANGKAVLFTPVYNMDAEEQARSLRKLSKLQTETGTQDVNALFALQGVEAAFTMHSGYTKNFEKAFAEWAERKL